VVTAVTKVNSANLECA